jgi:hypothetical protein
MVISYEKARNWLVVDPDSGIVIPHVRSSDPDKGWIEVYSTTACHPKADLDMIVIQDGVTDTRPYTFIEMRDPKTNRKEWLTRRLYCRFDVVDKYSGEVIFEVAGHRADERTRSPDRYAAEIRDVLR